MSLFSMIVAMSPSGGQGQGGDSSGGLISTVVMFGLIIAIFYFMIIRPQQKRQKALKAMVESMKRGDNVITASGIHGVVEDVDGPTVIVRVADNVKLKFEKSAITVVNS